MQRDEAASGDSIRREGGDVCGCIPDSASQGVAISGCVCQGVEKVVKREKTRRTVDIVKVALFAALLTGLVLALALWL
jgi:hypothetical protein